MKKTSEKRKVLALKNTQIDESSLFTHISKIIEKRKNRAGMYANREVTLMYWEIGRYIGSVLLGGERAEYGRKILATLSQELVKKYGSSFELRNMRRMIQFAELFPDLSIVSPLAAFPLQIWCLLLGVALCPKKNMVSGIVALTSLAIPYFSKTTSFPEIPPDPGLTVVPLSFPPCPPPMGVVPTCSGLPACPGLPVGSPI